MARSVKPEEYAEKRNAILDVAARYITTKGYEQMTTQDILEALQISRGAFYHYFESKQALLMALVERIGEQAEQLVLPIVSDRQMPAQDKLLRFFTVLDQYKQENKDLVFAFMRVWYADENALFRQKLYLARVKRLAPRLSQIIEEGKQIDFLRLVQLNEAAADALERVLGISPGGLRQSLDKGFSRCQALLE